MIDHLTLTVRDYARSKSFYEKALAPLGYHVVMELEDRCAFGPEKKPVFWITPGEPPTNPMHIAFAARRRADVDAFHAAALGEGAPDRGAPGVRANYHPSYYGAFVFDPDGHPIEAVNHGEAAAPRRAAEKVARRTAAPRRAAAKPAKPAKAGKAGKRRAPPARKVQRRRA